MHGHGTRTVVGTEEDDGVGGWGRGWGDLCWKGDLRPCRNFPVTPRVVVIGGISARWDLSVKVDSSVLGVGVGSSAAGELVLDGEESDWREPDGRGLRVGMLVVNGEGGSGGDLDRAGNGGGL